MVKKTGLGKGMGALLTVVEDERSSYFSCPIEEIRPNRSQPRKTFTSEKLEELTASLLAFDRELKTAEINPGTSADLTVACLFAYRVEIGEGRVDE
jgi:hypothetical protein